MSDLPLTLPPSRVPDPAEALPLRWGVIGPGGIARAFAEGLHRWTRSRIVAVGSRSMERARAFAEEVGGARAHGGYEALVADDEVDAVYVATPHSEHRDHALLAIGAGRHVLVEKAFTRTAAEAREVVAAARAADVTCLEAMWTRFLPQSDVVRQLVRSGEIGEIETVQADHGQWFGEDRTSRLFAPELAGGSLLDLGIYPVAFAVDLVGLPRQVLAAGTRAFTGVERQASLILAGFDRAPSAHAVLTTTLAARTPTTASVSGSLARVELAGEFYQPGRVRLVSRAGEVVEGPEPTIRGHLGLCHEAAHLATLVAEGRRESPLLPLDESVAVMELLDEVRRQIGVPL
ncbi:Gfo/Idh/MocA family protein [Arsenicicoccus dermatophilus]|uniref:Gfo/Idh/MocA family protein n=1 Tax=Arsenicicoccus dermatophilus TaxID=1076331 RepID=UPI001F4CB80A|nr:Gfo/Idh/MocA family oxidoreductase [Arsenicicoccus dermatophilus]MCH8613814.1 Gfo/Idh/MocA family oxidoreductase [Arsenicicoccus dermatophilus]